MFCCIPFLSLPHGDVHAISLYEFNMQFPRKVYKGDASGSFAEADLCHKQQALFVERL